MGLEPIVHMGDMGQRGMPSLGVFLRDPSSYLHVLRGKNTENSERLCRQALDPAPPVYKFYIYDNVHLFIEFLGFKFTKYYAKQDLTITRTLKALALG